MNGVLELLLATTNKTTHILQLFDYLQLLMCAKRWGIKRFNQMRLMLENQLLQPVQNEMLYAASIAMEAPRLCPVTSNLKHPNAGT